MGTNNKDHKASIPGVLSATVFKHEAHMHICIQGQETQSIVMKGP